jgi:hypothetical protein
MNACDPPPGCNHYGAYAPPNFYPSTWTFLYSQLGGPSSYTLDAAPTGDTGLYNQVKVFSQIYSFVGSVQINTPAGSAGSIYIRGKGIPYGTAYSGWLCY